MTRIASGATARCRLASCVVLAIAVSACAPPPLPERFDFEEIHKERIDEHCGGLREDCTRIEFDYVQLRDPPTDSDRELNLWILMQLLNVGSEDADVDRIMQRFVDDYREDLADVDPDFETVWMLTSSVRVLRNRREMLSLGFEYEEYSGGAHPNSGAQLVTLVPDPWRPLTLPEILEPGADERFQFTVEREFRESRGLDHEQSLTDQGLFVEGDRLPVPDNFALVPGGLRIRYNNYEIGPYSFGPTDLELSCSEIGSFLKQPYRAVCAEKSTV